MVRKGLFCCVILLLLAGFGFSVDWPTADLTYPHGGETFRPGQTVHVQWTVTTNNIAVCEQEVYLRVNNLRYLQGQFSGDARDFNWVVPNFNSKAYFEIDVGCETGPTKYESWTVQYNHGILIKR